MPVNRYDGTNGQVLLTEEQLASIFREESTGGVHTFDNAARLLIVGVLPAENGGGEASGVDKNTVASDLSRRFSEKMLSKLREDASITINSALITRF